MRISCIAALLEFCDYCHYHMCYCLLYAHPVTTTHVPYLMCVSVRYTRVITQLMEQGLNAKLYWKNDDLAHTVSLVPTSAHTGEGIPDLLRMLITLTQTRLEESLMFMDVLQCTVLEVKVIDGLGHTVDVVLVNGLVHMVVLLLVH